MVIGLSENKHEVVLLGGGCFWCTEAVFQRLDGVEKVTPGYSGGTLKNPTYNDICSGETGHAEVIEVVFNPKKISFQEILAVFFKTHDPTTLNRQGADVGTQYRSVIFYTSEQQRLIANETIHNYNETNSFGKPVVTEVSSLDIFYKAEDYHINYFRNNPNQPYCRFVIEPKVKKFMGEFEHIVK
jgi:peptide-methionine (S)-S-oxide reductase